MRIFGIIAVFVLTLVAILEGAALFRLSSRVDSLAQKLESGAAQATSAVRVKGDDAGRPGHTATPSTAAPLPLPRLLPPPAGDTTTTETAPATAVLRQALETSEGRAHLKAAMEVLREQDRQDRLVRNAEEEVADEQRYRERLTRLAALTPEEQNRVAQLHTDVRGKRQRVIEEMRAGLKTAEQADDEIDNLEDEVGRQIRALLGDQRMQKFREANRAERRRERAAQQGAPPAQP